MANIFLPILPHITAFILRINDLIQLFVNTPESVRKAIAEVLLLATVTSGLIAVTAGAAVAIGLITSVPFVLPALGIVAGSIAAVNLLFFSLRDALSNNAGLMQAFQTLLSIIGSAFGTLWQALQDLWHTLQGLTVLWTILKVVLAAVAVVIAATLLAGVLLVIGVFIALTVALTGLIQALGFLLGTLGEFFGSVLGKLGEVKDAAGAALGNTGEGIGNAWSRVGDLVQTVKDAISTGFAWLKERVQAIVQFVVGVFAWLYEHNYYFKGMVDGFTQVRDFTTSAWTGIRAGIAAAWTWIRDTVGGALAEVVMHVREGFTRAQQWATDTMHTIKQAVSSTLSSAVKTAQDALHHFLTALGNASRPVRDAIGQAVEVVRSALTDLAQHMLGWAENMMSMFIQGIQSRLGAMKDAAGSAAGTVAGWLGFHSPPKEGPLADSDQYMPTMMRSVIQSVSTPPRPLRRTGPTRRIVAATRPSVTGKVVIPVTVGGRAAGSYTVDLGSRSVIAHPALTGRAVRLAL